MVVDAYLARQLQTHSSHDTVPLDPVLRAVWQASLKRKWGEVGEEKAEAIRSHVKVDLDVKDQEDLAKTDAKTQASPV